MKLWSFRGIGKVFILLVLKSIMISDETRLKLRDLREILENNLEFFGFPRSFCHLTSKEVEKSLGFKRICGRYFDNQEGKYFYHEWNIDSSGEIFIDLTADQFDSSLPSVYITDWTDSRYLKGNF
jgi:hypothetical protein